MSIQKKIDGEIRADSLKKEFSALILKYQSDEEIKRAEGSFHRYLETQSRDLRAETLQKFFSELTHQIALHIKGNTQEKMAALIATRALLKSEVEGYLGNKIVHLGVYVRDCSVNSDVRVMKMAVRCLKTLASMEGTLVADFVDGEIKRSFSSLEQTEGSSSARSQSDSLSIRRHSAVLSLEILAKHSPTLFFIHVGPFFNLIWSGLLDKQTAVREASAAALRAVLFLVSMRRTPNIKEWYKHLYQRAKNGLDCVSLEILHGSILAVAELLRKPGEFMRNKFQEVSLYILKLINIKIKDDKTGIIHSSILATIPPMASLNPDEFVDNHQEDLVRHLLDATMDDTYRGVAFRSLGRLAKCLAASQKLSQSFLEMTLKTVKTIFLRLKNRVHDLDDIMICIKLLAEAAGPTLSRISMMNDILSLIFSSGLRESMTECVTALATHDPSILPDIQVRLLNVISMILAKKSYDDILIGVSGSGISKPESSSLKVPGKIKGGAMRKSGSFTTPVPIAMSNSESIPLALKVLGTFDFETHRLDDFVRDFLLNFLNQEDFRIRKQAALTCAKIAIHPGEEVDPMGKKGATVGDIISKLLMVGISDRDPEIRKTVLSSLAPRYDPYLGTAENLKCLFMGLNDEVFEIRWLSIGLIGRLATQNPAYVMPSLRKTLVQLLTELEFSGNPRLKEESTRLLTGLIQSSGNVTKPYAKTILDVLLPKIHDESPRVASAVLAALGELSQVAEKEMKGCVDELFPLILETLMDQSSVFAREIALKALGQLVSNLGYVIAPYERYPNLLPRLLNVIKTETNPINRMEVLKVFGILGALDPYRHRLSQIEEARAQEDRENQNRTDPSESESEEGGGDDDERYSVAAVSYLIKILGETTLEKHHITVITVLMCICRTMRSRCSIFLPEIMPLFIKILRSGDLGIHDMLFQQISILVELAKDQIRDYLDDIFGLVHAFWDTNILIQILGLVEKLVKILDAEIKAYLPGLVPLLLRMLQSSDHSDRRLKVLSTLDVIGVHLADYLHLVIPTIVKVIEMADLSSGSSADKSLTIFHLQTLGRLCSKLDISDYASRITNPLLRVLQCGDGEVQQSVMEVISVLVFHLGSDYAVFVPNINSVLTRQKIDSPHYKNLVSSLLKNQQFEIGPDSFVRHGKGVQRADSEKNLISQIQVQRSKLLVNVENLKKAWKASHANTKDDWHEWMRRFSVALLRESPSYALHQCLALAQVYHPLARSLFNSSFLSCWREFEDDEKTKRDCIENLHTALEANEIPPDILHALLNLAEFMEHNLHPLPIPHNTLGDLAEKNHAYAKALHCKEIEFQQDPTTCIEALISINNQLGLPEASGGILTYAQQQQGMDLKESWYEKLMRWEEALAAYEAKQEEDPDNLELMIDRLRCYNALGEWESSADLSKAIWSQGNSKIRNKISPISATGFMHLQKYDTMEKYVDRIDEDSINGSFYRAIIACHKGRFEESRKFIFKTREYLDTELTALVSESYKRAYPMLCKVQQLSELEEVIQYKDNEERRPIIRAMWKKRILGCQRDVDVWRSLLSVRALALSRHDDIDVYLKYSSLLKANGRYRAAHTILMSMTDHKRKSELRALRMNRVDPRVAYHYVKYLWAVGSKSAALQGARSFIKANEGHPLQPRMYHNIAEWKMDMDGASRYESSLVEVLAACKACSENAPNWYKSWHSWALTNFEAVSFYEKHESSKARKKIVKHLVAAINGFFRSIALSPGKSLQDTLRLLTLMFKHGGDKQAEAALMMGFSSVSVDTWLQVIPQVIARIHSPSKTVRNLVKELLKSVGIHHPQALVYPLTVASTSHPDSTSTASIVLQQMREHSEKLVEQARLVSSELIRVSINWFESWNVGLATASTQFYKQSDSEGMLATLAPLHQMMEEGAQTQNEVSFTNLFGRKLRDAQRYCQQFSLSGRISYLHSAWQNYYEVYRTNSKLLIKPFLMQLDLQYVSPYLLDVDDLDLAIPGTYQANQEIVKIHKITPVLTVINSKQRPRRMTMVGSNMKDYMFLLKGHEDLRQDERVMQLFGLVNTLLAEGENTGKLHLRITRYGAIPLSPNSGLIGWVPGCNTLHELIRQQRTAQGMPLKVEYERQAKFAPKQQIAPHQSQFDYLTLMQKVEAYQYAIASTPGDEFARILWLRSPNSEIWLDRRTQFTRSLAVMSMVGYILGLGDRHPSNLMLERNTGKILHIDFGDCFEVGMLRENYPENIPFRLTRMLIAAMEVSGIEGNYRSTCEWVMRLLREHKESLMALLEAFVYDPLVNWRFTSAETDTGDGNAKTDSMTEGSPGEEESSSGSVPTSQSVAVKRIPQMKKSKKTDKDSARGGSPNGGEEDPQQAEMLNERAVEVISRVHKKLTGQDFSDEVLDVEAQVHKLVAEATSHENLCQLYGGWGPFW